MEARTYSFSFGRTFIAHTHSGGVVWAETTFQISTRGRNQTALIFVSALQVKISQIRRRCVWARNYVGHYHISYGLIYESYMRLIFERCGSGSCSRKDTDLLRGGAFLGATRVSAASCPVGDCSCAAR